MLVLTRKAGQTIVLHTSVGDVTIRTSEATRLVIDAPRAVNIVRGEVLERRMCDVARAEMGVGA